MSRDTIPSFSSHRRWLFGLNILLLLAALSSILVMVNYLAARHFRRFPLSSAAPIQLSPLTKRILESVTNQIHVTIFFKQSDPLYESVQALLKEYKYVNHNISIESVDYQRKPAAASLIKAKYKLSQLTDKDMVIFESNERSKFVYQNELTDLDISALLSGESREIRRTHFKGELMFTSAIFSLISSRPLKAYFLQNHNEHPPTSDDPDQGYSKFASVLKRNNISWARLDLSGPNDIPPDCNLLILAGPTTPLLDLELDKIDAYLKSGGRLLLLLNYYGVNKHPGLTRILSDWGIDLGQNIVRDLPNSYNREDILVTRFGLHPIVKPLFQSGLYLIVPRSVRRLPQTPNVAGSPDVTELIYTGPQGTILTDIRNGIPYPNPASDVVTNVSLAVAVEKGKIKDVTADRGTTRIVVVGESLFLSNRMIDSAGNSDFASLAVNWLLDQSELLGNLGPRPIREYRTTLTNAEMVGARWLLLFLMPGAVFLVGFLVWMRRRK